MVTIAAFYSFSPIPPERVAPLQQELTARFGKTLRGLVLVSVEGINGTVSGDTKALDSFKQFVSSHFEIPEDVWKYSEAEKHPFRRFKVDQRQEVVTMKHLEAGNMFRESYLTPEQWDEVCAKEDVTIIDTRNWYETKLGKFKGAIDPHLDRFSQWPDYLKSSNLPKDQRYLIYCTGGIRCEKAIAEMHAQGFTKVNQLAGGILRYFEQRPNSRFEGECFVFDHRVAVDQELQPTSSYQLCIHCGNPAQITPCECTRCNSPSRVCNDCKTKDTTLISCSKNCAYHLKRGSRTKRMPRRSRQGQPRVA